jgi:hypothetical protein
LENKKAKCGVIEMSEFDLKKSEKIGQLYPVLVDAKGNVIDGFHRLEADPNWRREKLSEIDTEEKLHVARCVANWHRREVPREEKEEWINGLAKIYKEQGLKISAGSEHKNEIIEKIVEVTGLDITTVRDYISPEFKQEQPEHLREQKPKVPASQVIERAFKQRDYGRQLVERHREEVEQQLRPRIESEVRERIIEEEIKPKVKEELSRDVEFIREAIEKAPEVLPTLPEETIERARKLVEPKEMGVKEGIVYTVGEYECPNCKRHYWIRCNGKKDWVE